MDLSDTWVHLVLSVTPGSIRLYTDGVEQVNESPHIPPHPAAEITALPLLPRDRLQLPGCFSCRAGRQRHWLPDTGTFRGRYLPKPGVSAPGRPGEFPTPTFRNLAAVPAD